MSATRGGWRPILAAGQAPRLMLVLSREAVGSRDPLEVLEGALSGGAGIVQVREKSAEQPEELAAWIRRVLSSCRRRHVPVLVNDHVELARATGADGVHLGQGDAHPAFARGRLGPQALIGLSTHDAGEIRRSAHEDLDYLGLGCLFPTRTKAVTAQGVDTLAPLVKLSCRPIYGIGGVDAAQAPRAASAGFDHLAVASALTGAQDPRAAAQTLCAAWPSQPPSPPEPLP